MTEPARHPPRDRAARALTDGDPGEPEIEILPDADAAAAAAANRIAAAVIDAVRRRGRADWATTGGSTPIPIYRHLAAPPLRSEVPWDRVHVWWGDDRYVPRDHPLSNRLAFDEILLGLSGKAGMSGDGTAAVDIRLGAEPGVPIPVANVHAMPIDAAIAGGSPETAAAAYAEELRAAPLERNAAGLPVLDVILVGVGPDGHVCSVFPESPLLESSEWVAAVPAPEHVEPHVARVTLSPALVGAGRLPLAVVLGAGKARIVADILTGPRDARRWPSQVVRRAGAVWILDEAAAARLPGSERREASRSGRG